MGGASAPAPPADSAQLLITEYVAACAHRPPRDVLGHLGREVSKLLAEGVEAAHIRAGLRLHRAKGLHPSTLPSLVHEAINADNATQAGTRPHAVVPVRHVAWTNPTSRDAYDEEL